MNALAHHRFPWTPAEEAIVVERKHERACHKVIARELQRTPRSVDQHVARMKERGLLEMHRLEEMETLEKVLAEATSQEMLGSERR